MSTTSRVSILLFDEVEVLDACGPFEVFSVANRVSLRERPEVPPPFAVTTVAVGQERTIRARGGLHVVATHLLGEEPTADIVIVPGGVTAKIERDPEVLMWTRTAAAAARITASVCTGVFVLAEAGVIVDSTVTTHWEDIAELRQRFPRLDVTESQRYVDNGHVATSAGVSAGIDLALHLVARTVDLDLAVLTARQMDYRWTRAEATAAL